MKKSCAHMQSSAAKPAGKISKGPVNNMMSQDKMGRTNTGNKK